MEKRSNLIDFWPPAGMIFWSYILLWKMYPRNSSAMQTFDYALASFGVAFVCIYLGFWLKIRSAYRQKIQAADRYIGDIQQKLFVANNPAAASEKITHDEIKRILTRRGIGKSYLYESECIVFDKRSKEAYTQEIDHLFITEFGVFIIESKGYIGYIRPEGDEVTHSNGQKGRNPEIQSRRKIRKAQAVLGTIAPVHFIGVFTNNRAILSHAFSGALIKIGDLEGKIDQLRDEYQVKSLPPVSVENAKHALEKIVKLGPEARRAHNESQGFIDSLSLENELEYQRRQKDKIRFDWPHTLPEYRWPIFGALILSAMLSFFYVKFLLSTTNEASSNNISDSSKLANRPNKGATSEQNLTPIWIPPPPPPMSAGWSTPEQVARSKANAPVVNDLLNKATRCFRQRRFQCAYESAYEAYRIDPTNGIAQALMRNAINEQNNLIARANTKRQQQGSTSMQAPQNLPGYISQPNPTR